VGTSVDGIAVQGVSNISRADEVQALCRGALTLSRDGQRIAALELLWAAVALEPTNFVAHRHLAAALTNAGDVDAAADEYARFIEFMLKQGDVRRAANELVYARAFLGDMPQLEAAATHAVTLADVGQALSSAAANREMRPITPALSSGDGPSNGNGHWPTVASRGSGTVVASTHSHQARRHRRWQRWLESRSWGMTSDALIVILVATVAAVIALMVTTGGR
jgi:hypothetical protein